MLNINKLCAWRQNMPPPLYSPVGAQAPSAPPSRRNVAVLSHAEYVPTLTAVAALRVRHLIQTCMVTGRPATRQCWFVCMRACVSVLQVGVACCQLALGHGLRVLATAGTERGVQMLHQNRISSTFNHNEKGYIRRIEASVNKRIQLLGERFVLKIRQNATN